MADLALKQVSHHLYQWKRNITFLCQTNGICNNGFDILNLLQYLRHFHLQQYLQSTFTCSALHENIIITVKGRVIGISVIYAYIALRDAFQNAKPIE